MADYMGSFETVGPAPYDTAIQEKVYRFKTGSPLFEYLLFRRRQWINGRQTFYRLNCIITALLDCIRDEGLFNAADRKIVICDEHLQKALGRRWFRVNDLLSILKQQLILRVRPFGGSFIELCYCYHVEIETILSLLKN